MYMKLKKISETELAVLNLLWDRKEPVPSREMLRYFKETTGEEMKKQTLNNFLTRLLDKDLIRRISADRRYFYEPLISREQYQQSLAENFINEAYGGSFRNLVCALSGGEKITEEEAREIKKLLEK